MRKLFMTSFFVISLMALSLMGCGDRRPDAAGAAHIFNSHNKPVRVEVAAENGNTVNFSLAAQSGQFVPLRKADTYVVSVIDPPDLSSYYEEIVIPADDTSDTVFDIGASGSFILYPTYHVPQDMLELAALGAVERMKKEGNHQDYIFDEPAPRHDLPRGVFYSFNKDVDSISRLTNPGQKVEIRYKLAPYDGLSPPDAP